ncbi:MAG: serine hydrolase [Acidobacteria bacterium]|nr:serine hydrolase [Acidobacteriota bacterium]
MRIASSLLLALTLSAAPDDGGLDRAKLDAVRDRLAARQTASFLVLRRGRIAYEWYSAKSGPDKPHYTASLAKALVGGMSLVAALDDGRMKPDDPAWKHIPAWKDDPRRSKVTIRQLATHTSGIQDAEHEGTPHDKLTGWMGAFWARKPDPFTVALHQAPVIFEPGTDNAYSNPGMAALAYAVTASLKGAPQSDIDSLLRERFMRPLGVADRDWSIGYGRAYEVDGMKLYANWGGGGFTARATARVGLLMLQRGQWNGRQLVSRAWVEKVLTHAGMPDPKPGAPGDPVPSSGLAWWLNAKGSWPGVPRDAFAGAGAGQQLLVAIPSLDLVIVRNGGAMNPPGGKAGFWRPLVDEVIRPVVEAVAEPAPYPPSSAIRGVTFAPASEIVRKAVGSDNWPLTWMDDGAQFTSYGDGWGFEPRVEKKLSMGFARLTGGPADFRAENVRSASGERVGDGRKGAKASGLLMVDKALYMWVRNVDVAQLVWSEDRGRSWTWGFKFETGFATPAFLNFGRNYAGARDEYVYLYSQDGASAYESDDRLVLARAPKSRLRERAAWEFFVRPDEAGRAVWTRDIAQCGEAFRYPRNVQRVDAVYHPGLKRYLLALGYNHEGGWGLYDAPEPWGPWTTAFHTPHWGFGGTHGYRLPAKWIEADGKTMWLVFSGTKENDAFCLRRLTLETGTSRTTAPTAP